MIWDALFALLRAALNGLAAVLPSWDPIDLAAPLAVIAGAGGELFGLVEWADQYSPVKLALASWALLFGLDHAAFVWRGVLWVGSKLHLLGGGSR